MAQLKGVLQNQNIDNTPISQILEPQKGQDVRVSLTTQDSRQVQKGLLEFSGEWTIGGKSLSWGEFEGQTVTLMVLPTIDNMMNRAHNLKGLVDGLSESMRVFDE